MYYTGAPISVAIVFAAWVITGVYFIASAFKTKRIQSKEAGQKRTLDSVLLLGGYVLLFIRVPNGAFWTNTFVPAASAARVGWAGTVLVVAGLSFTMWARISLGQYWSRIVGLKEDHKLVQSGPYQWVRHPLYSGLLLGTLGAALTFGLVHCILGTLLLWIGFISRAGREDALLGQQFGAEFAAYRARSGRLLPRFSR